VLNIPAIKLRAEKLTLVILCSVFAKACIDYFSFNISPIFGVYGVQPTGEPFSDLYWASWGIFFAVFSFFLLYIKRRKDIFDYGVCFLFFSLFIPLLSMLWIENAALSFVAFCALFWSLLFVALSLVPRVLPPLERETVFELRLGYLYLLIIFVLMGMLIANFGVSWDLSFESVYDRRKVFAAWLDGSVIAYLYAWSVYVFASYLIFISRNSILKLAGLLYIFLFYLVAGDKIYLFLVLVIFAIKVMIYKGGATLLLCLFILLSLAGTLFWLVGNEIWIPTIVQRFLIMPSDISLNYIDYFGKENLLYGYGFLSSVFDYGYTDMPSKVIGAEYYTAGDNATVNFLADAYVNFGWASMAPLLLFFMSLRLLLPSSRYLVLLVPIFVQAVDTPLPTILLTGGGGVIIVTAFVLTHLVPRGGIHDRPAIKVGN
jgi:hypothetical protein